MLWCCCDNDCILHQYTLASFDVVSALSLFMQGNVPHISTFYYNIMTRPWRRYYSVITWWQLSYTVISIVDNRILRQFDERWVTLITWWSLICFRRQENRPQQGFVLQTQNKNKNHFVHCFTDNNKHLVHCITENKRHWIVKATQKTNNTHWIH